VLLNGTVVDALSFITHRERANSEGRFRIQNLSQLIHRQLFDTVIQASCQGKIIGREVVKALRKDVTAKCYGGDITRKRKLLEKQKVYSICVQNVQMTDLIQEGKKKMRQIGQVQLSKEVFQSVLKKR